MGNGTFSVSPALRIMLLAATATLALQAPRASAEQAPAGANDASGSGAGEIIATAAKRPESLQGGPFTATAVSGQNPARRFAAEETA